MTQTLPGEHFVLMEFKDDQNCYQANQDEQNYGYFAQYSLTGHIAITLNETFKMYWRDEMTLALPTVDMVTMRK